jgi:arylsulfatase
VVRLQVNGRPVGEGTLRRSIGYTTPAGEDVTVSADPGTPVTDEYPVLDNRFSGVVHWVRIASGQGIQAGAADLARVANALQ